MGAHIARTEKTPLIPNTPTNEAEVKAELAACAQELNAIPQLEAFQQSIGATKESDILRGSGYYLLVLNTAESPASLAITGYHKSQLEEAITDSTEAEKDPNLNVVLVSVSSLKTLRRAYPNYFADTESFLRILKEAIA